MTKLDIVRWRLDNQRLTQTTFKTPGEVVAWFGAVQAQDYLGALWALGLRLPNTSEEAIEQAIANKTIVRTWPMRGTLHFVAPEDARWMLKLLTPRVIARSAGLYRRFELDETVFAQAREALITALQGGKQLPRKTIYQVLEAAGIPTGNQRGLHLLGWLAQEGVICFGGREGKQATITLLTEWAPAAKTLARDEALAELARRYFTSHGPATVQDFGWWSGLPAADARAGLEMAKPHLVSELIEGQTYWLAESLLPTPAGVSPRAYLLPAFDEYTVAYKDRSAVLDPDHIQRSSYGLDPTIVLDGQIVGTWQRTLKKETVIITPDIITPLDQAGRQALAEAADRYSAFLGKAAILSG